MFVIKPHNHCITGLDYHKFKNIIVTSSADKSIKFWGNNNGSLLI